MVDVALSETTGLFLCGWDGTCHCPVERMVMEHSIRFGEHSAGKVR
jgi:hypothetical protein